MSSKVFTVVFIASTFATAALAQQASAPAVNQRAVHRFEHRLRITAQQREQVRALLLQEQPKLQQLRQSLVAEHNEMASASASGSFDAATARGVAARYADVNADAAVERARLRTDLLAILTPEQQQKLQQLRARIVSFFPAGLDETPGATL